MIKIHSEYDFENDVLRIKKYKYKHTNTFEHLGLIDVLIKEIIEQGQVSTRKEVLNMLKKPLTEVKDYE